ncbi:MAG: WecB/TagA/CpsF family glycosyltransferase [bacterium]|nr:WecB/TagA/CpsF family glycosyltransferase [bacterium]MDZ4248021.1 WecB/TagA/CpsF family glycosyltransferase [Patescibacteria group bacterium]
MKDSVSVLGVEVDAVTAPELLVALRQAIEAGKRQQIVTVTTEMIMRSRRHPEHRRLINQADWRLADAIGVVWGASFLSRPLRGPLKTPRLYLRALRTGFGAFLMPRTVKKTLPDTVPGSELTVDLAGMCEEFGHGLYLLGGARGVAEAAAAELRQRFPELKVTADGADPTADQEAAVRRRIKQSKSQILLVAYGAPVQEEWIRRNLPKLPKPLIAVGVGGTLDYLGGGRSLTGGGEVAKPPPRAVRGHGLEWLWRLFTQPSRWRRIMSALPAFVWAVVRAKQGSTKR